MADACRRCEKRAARKKQKRLFRAALFCAYACAARSWASLRARSIRMAARSPSTFSGALPFSKIAPTA